MRIERTRLKRALQYGRTLLLMSCALIYLMVAGSVSSDADLQSLKEGADSMRPPVHLDCRMANVPVAFAPLCRLQDENAKDLHHWIDTLSSDNIDERAEAARKLRAIGKGALPELKRVAKEIDLAAHLIKVIELAQEIPGIAKLFPGAEERILTEGRHGWTEFSVKVSKHEEEADPTMADIPPRERTMLLVRALEGARSDEECSRILQEVRSYKVIEAIPELSKILDSKERDHNLALAVLGELKDPRVAPLLIAGLKESDPEVRLTALKGLLEIGGNEVVQALMAALRDSCSGVRYWAVQALAWKDAAEAKPFLRELLSDEEPSLKVEALNALDRLGATEAINDIIPLLEDPSGPVALTAASALSGLGSRKGVQFFLERRNTLEPCRLSYHVKNVWSSWDFHPPGFEVLNGARQPDLWRRLKKSKFGCATFKGTGRQALEKAAQDARLRLEIREDLPNAAREWLSGAGSLGWYYWFPDTSLWVLERVHYDGLRLVVEPDRIRYLLPEEEMTFRKSWWESEQKK